MFIIISLLSGTLIHETAHLLPDNKPSTVAVYSHDEATEPLTIQASEVTYHMQIGDGNIRLYANHIVPYLMTGGLWRPAYEYDYNHDYGFASAAVNTPTNPWYEHSILLAPILAGHLYQTLSILLVAIRPNLFTRALLYGSSISLTGAIVHVVDFAGTHNRFEIYLLYALIIIPSVLYALLQPRLFAWRVHRHLNPKPPRRKTKQRPVLTAEQLVPLLRSDRYRKMNERE